LNPSVAPGLTNAADPSFGHPAAFCPVAPVVSAEVESAVAFAAAPALVAGSAADDNSGAESAAWTAVRSVAAALRDACFAEAGWAAQDDFPAVVPLDDSTPEDSVRDGSVEQPSGDHCALAARRDDWAVLAD
jgi:hypothetical protein